MVALGRNKAHTPMNLSAGKHTLWFSAGFDNHISESDNKQPALTFTAEYCSKKGTKVGLRFRRLRTCLIEKPLKY